MKAILQILRYQLRDAARSRWVLAYGVLFLLLTEGLFRFGGGGERVIVSLLNAVLLLVPLVGLLFGALHFYHSREFMELMLAQPLERHSSWPWRSVSGCHLPGTGKAAPHCWYSWGWE
jgi:Cu-processing system permease protein